ncbi:peptidoglycan-binding protein [Cellulomonas chitinilytica]|uniref:peptidoglycan-binding protein n=1 Tax=Cellulomonas chitinilytica TaxID=398759 RepID=UPI001943FA5E|nr:peptidoglycan-binding protein [Cellulomonas chitinilytica]
MSEQSGPRRARWLAVWVVVSLLVTSVAFALGTLVRSPSEAAAANSREKVPVTARVTQREITAEETVVTGKVAAGTRRDVVPAATSASASRSVLTGRSVDAGAVLLPGTAPIEVNSRPLVTLTLPFDLFRDLGPGMEGSDVRAVQEGLAGLHLFRGTPDGRFGRQTSAAIRALYARVGASAPAPSTELSSAVEAANEALTAAEAALQPAPTSPEGALDAPTSTAGLEAAVTKARADLAAATAAADTPLPAAEILSLPSAPVQLVSVAAVGTDVTEAPALTLRSGDTTVVARASVAAADQLAVGATATITGASDTSVSASATVTAVSDFRSAATEEGTPPGFDITLTLGADSVFDDGALVVVTPDQAPEAASGPAVPLVAVRHDSDGSYVMAGGGTPARVAVTVVASGQGWAIVESGLHVGDVVQVSG